MKRHFLSSFLLGLFVFTFCTLGYAVQTDDDKFVVVLDAGHGGHDPGNLGNGYFEKNIALSIVLNIGRILEKSPDIKVIYTRKNDTFVDLYVRGEIANKANADLFVSVHCDSHTSNAHGAGTFVLGLHANKQNFEIAKKENSVIYLEDDYESRYADYDINSPESVIGLTIMQEEFLDQSIALAKMIQDNFSGKLKRNDRKVKQAGFIVLHQTFMPSVLVETGFLTNKGEGAYLNSRKGQEEMGKAIAEAILLYKKNVPSSGSAMAMTTIPTVPEPPRSNAEDATENNTIAKGTDEKLVDDRTVLEAREAEVLVDHEPEEEKELAVAHKTPEENVGLNRTAAETVNDTPVIAEAKEEAEKEPVQLFNRERSDDETDVVFRVQLMASAKNLPTSSDHFNGLNRITKEPYKNLYRYMYGGTNSIREAKLLKSNADLKGYPSSYIVGYRDGVRISAREVAKYLSD